eukprot:PhF_6_TR3894/c0_g1_i1/m.5491
MDLTEREVLENELRERNQRLKDIPPASPNNKSTTGKQSSSSSYPGLRFLSHGAVVTLVEGPHSVASEKAIVVRAGDAPKGIPGVQQYHSVIYGRQMVSGVAGGGDATGSVSSPRRERAGEGGMD